MAFGGVSLIGFVLFSGASYPLTAFLGPFANVVPSLLPFLLLSS